MQERLVDVKTGGSVLHTFPITIGDRNAEAGEHGFIKKALEAAANANLVPNRELQTLSASMHICRSGPLEPDSDRLSVLSETKAGLDQVVRERAFRLWEQAGRPDNRADEFWFLAQHQRLSERAYALWERESRPQGKADEQWYRQLNFESS